MTRVKDYIGNAISPVTVGIVPFAEELSNKRLYPLQRVLLKLMFLEEMEGWEEDLLSYMINGGRNGDLLLSPDIRKRRDISRDQDRDHFSEIVMVGGRRSGKGYMTGLAGAYKLYRVQQLENPGEFYGIDVDKSIDFMTVAASFDQAKTLQFADLRSAITNCTALAPMIGKDLEESLTIKHDSDIVLMERMKTMGIKVSRDFAKLRVRPMAANAETIRGTASIFLVFDEMAHMMPGESRSAAQQVYGAAEPALAQFGRHSLVFCNSSPYTKVGQFFEQYELAMRSEQHAQGWYATRFAFQFPSWALYDKWWADPDRRWRNAIMVSPDWPDQLEQGVDASNLDRDSKGKREEERLKERANPDTYKVERRAQWAEVLDAYLDPVKVDQAYSGILPNGQMFHSTISGQYIFEYRAHCDPSSTTAGFGFAIAHVEEFPDPTGIFPDGIARHVVFDQVKRWNPQDFSGGTINYIRVREELEQIVKVYYPKELTFDQYNSVGLIQELREATRSMNLWEIHIGEVKATSQVNWNRWEAFKTALYLGLVHIPPDCIDTKSGFNHSEYSALELKFLQEIATGQNKRVDKQDLGPIQTKDIADCIAEVTVKFLGSYLGNFMSANLAKGRLATGAEGGYQIGGRHQGGPMQDYDIAAKGNSGNRFESFYNQQRGSSSPARARGIQRKGRR